MKKRRVRYWWCYNSNYPSYLALKIKEIRKGKAFFPQHKNSLSNKFGGFVLFTIASTPTNPCFLPPNLSIEREYDTPIWKFPHMNSCFHFIGTILNRVICIYYGNLACYFNRVVNCSKLKLDQLVKTTCIEIWFLINVN